LLEFRLRAVAEVLSWDNGKVETGVRMEHRGVQAAGISDKHLQNLPIIYAQRMRGFSIITTHN
jgi:hypothetical protein